MVEIFEGKRLTVGENHRQQIWDAKEWLGPGLASRTTFRCPWKFISRIYPDFLHLTKIQMGTVIR